MVTVALVLLLVVDQGIDPKASRDVIIKHCHESR